MGVRPPSNDTKEPDAIEFGIAAVDARLTDGELEFPATADEVVEALGDPTISYDAHGNGIDLSEAVEATATRHFETEQELLNALHPVFEERRSAASNSIVRQFRSLLPF